MSQRTLKRGAAQRPSRRAPKESWVDRLLARSPVGHETLRKAATVGIVGGVCAVAIVGATWLGLPAAAANAAAEGVGEAGLRVEQIEVTGLRHMDRMTVYAIALDQKSRAMPLVDLDAVRSRLLEYGWIADAHVSRRLPDTLLIHIDERQPTAVWQDRGRLTLISDDGTLLAPVSPETMPNLPLVIGPNAYAQEEQYRALLAVAPDLGRRVRAATWVGNRRWNLAFRSGETLALPSGREDAARALAKFAELERSRPILGKGWIRFDLRDPTRLVARRPGAPDGALPGTTATSTPIRNSVPAIESGQGGET